jgi:Circadian oscillating protein COP23
MNIKQILKLTVTGLVLMSQTPVLIAGRSLASGSEVFECVTVTPETHYATLATIQDKEGNPVKVNIIDWQTSEFSPKGYTQSVRCNVVTNKLNKAISENDGQLRNLWLTVGQVGNYLVLCHVNNVRSGCNENNMLFTFKAEHRLNPSEVLATLLNISVTEQGNPVQESRGQAYVNLETLVKQKLVSETNYF